MGLWNVENKTNQVRCKHLGIWNKNAMSLCPVCNNKELWNMNPRGWIEIKDLVCCEICPGFEPPEIELAIISDEKINK
jgi:hypothetical protein